MKISKLFHWLYALVMLLPIFAIGSACLINTFNMEAKQEAKVNYAYQTNEVTNINDLVEGNIYSLNLPNFTTNLPSGASYYFGQFYNIKLLEFNYSTWDINQSNPLTWYEITINRTNNNIYIASWENTTYKTQITIPTANLINDLVFNFVYKSSFNNDFISYVSICNDIPIVSVEQKEYEFVFFDAIEKVEQSPLFNWAYDSFLATPITYISDLFGIASNSPVILLMSYWLAISIIWLVFDLVMYVPLLVHRWIDKGVLE